MTLKTILPAIVFAAVALGAGIAQGIYSERWIAASTVDDAVKLIDNIPATIGDWQGTQKPLDASDLARAGIKGHYYYNYVDSRTGAALEVFLVCGRPGPISVHTPDICYAGAGYQTDGDPQIQLVDLGQGISQQLWSAKFRKPNSLNAPQLEIFWTWSAGDGWSAPENPRFAFAKNHALYKLYVIRHVSPRDKESSKEIYKDFLKSLLPALNKALGPKASA
jgi:hypothetical protein